MHHIFEEKKFVVFCWREVLSQTTAATDKSPGITPKRPNRFASSRGKKLRLETGQL